MSDLPPHPAGRRVWSFQATKEKELGSRVILSIIGTGTLALILCNWIHV